MYAVVMQEFGGPSVLRFDRHPDPLSRPGWVTVRLQASALNWHDVLVRRGLYRSPLPHILGADGAGVRTDTNEEVVILPSLFWGSREAAPGTDWEILGDHRAGTYAELVTVPEECVVPRPAGLSLTQAAALPLVGVTTYRALFTRGRLRAGESVLILGAGGGVATMATSFAAAHGAHVVVTSSDSAKIAAARELGAAAGVDHQHSEWIEHARSLTPGAQGFDLVLDSVGRWSESIQCLRSGGRCVVLGSSVADEAQLPLRPFYFGQFELIGTTMGSPTDMGGLLRFMENHDVSPPVVDRTFGLGEASRAHEQLESGSSFGKIVLLH
ncbi:zinc-binding dehydrogenase [Rhodococcus globerulus]|uniref:Zinc-binding dehydrogenase n=1 Tax=Rhodococcus globerulus TaxID=33008 RepID=A0ABU4C4H7_RHOGO|nr:zinc-binding dehydrogenase [Rhodococcus globerulus]MDV6271194.1 zinc-binding dehydrogenase [Rhodococcus globerulus]